MNFGLVDLYEAILKTGWLITDEKKYVYRDLSVGEAKKEPFIILDKQVALPTRENLNNSGKENLLIFHPLLEGLIGGESPVIGKLRRAYSIRFTYAATTLFTSLLACGGHSSETSKFSPDQMDLLKVLSGNITDSTIETWNKILKISLDKHKSVNGFADIYISSNVVVDGEAYSRYATVRFPIYEELAKDKDKFFGHSLVIKKSDRKIFMNLFEFMFPGIEHKNHYSRGTNSRIAPFLDALLKTFSNLFSITNNLYDNFNNVVKMDPSIKVELDWVDKVTPDIEFLKNLAHSVPQQYGNYPVKTEDVKRETTGSNVVGFQKSEEAPAVKQQSFNQSQLAPQAQVHIQQPEQPTEVEKPNLQTYSIGIPLSEANGVVGSKVNDLSANIVNSATGRTFFDPKQALVNQVQTVYQKGGVGRVAATQADNSVYFNNNNNNLNANFPMNNNGWNNSNNGFGANMSNINAPAMAREIARARLNGQAVPFAQNGMIDRGSII